MSFRVFGDAKGAARSPCLVPLLLLLLIVPATAAWAAGGGGGGGGGGGFSAPRPTREGQAIKAYQSGERDLAKAAKYLAELESTDSEKKRRKLRKKANGRFESAVKDFRRAIEKKDDLIQAHAQLGFALRSLGRYEEALEAYDAALAIEPRYGEAIEYRAEAYLELGRLEDCKIAYLQLYRGVPELAAQLMEKMKGFVAHQQAGAGQPNGEELAAFAQWVEERDVIARQTSRLGTTPSRSW